MAKDYRISFLTDVEVALTKFYSSEQISQISNVIVKTLSDYEIVARCTDLVPSEDGNERLIKRYRACLMVDGLSENTIYQYDRSIRRLITTIPKPLTEMGAYDIRFFLASEQDRGLSSRSVENMRANISAFFQWMTNEDLISKNPVSKLKSIKYPVEVRIPFSDVEIDALKSGCKTLKERAVVEMLLSTGVRVSELASMDVKDVNTETLAVHVIHGKGSKERVTYTTPVSVKHLLRYLEQRKENGTALFYNKDHKRMNSGGIRYILNEVASRVGVKNVHPHRFRRTFATNLARRGMDVQEVQRLLGHSSLNTTMRYVCVDDSNVQASYNKYIA